MNSAEEPDRNDSSGELGQPGPAKPTRFGETEPSPVGPEPAVGESPASSGGDETAGGGSAEPQVRSDSVWLAEPAAATGSSVGSAPGTAGGESSLTGERAARPGPGPTEAVLWTFAVVAVHVLAAGLAAAVVFAGRGPLRVEPGGSAGPAPSLTPGVVLIAAEMSAFVAFAFVAAVLRYGPQVWRLLPLAPLTGRQFLTLVGLAVPLSFACGRLHYWMTVGWDKLVEHWPWASELSRAGGTEALVAFAKDSPLTLLLVLLAAAPAVGEELMFRGLIGTGLVARKGLVGGVLLTSLLFAGVHMHPAQAVAILPLAVVLHLVYLATRTLWGPILLHFCNNAIAVAMMKTAEVGPHGELTAQADGPALLTVLAVVSSVAFACYVWQTRVCFRLPDGRTWSPGYATAARPPHQLQAVAAQPDAGQGTLAVALVSLAAFVALLAWWA